MIPRHLKPERKKYKREYMRVYQKGYVQRLRGRVMDALGGKFCVKCGCDRLEILEINHIAGGGRKSFATGLHGLSYYRSILKDKNKKKKYDIRCRVCNALHYVQIILGIEGHRVTWKEK